MSDMGVIFDTPAAQAEVPDAGYALRRAREAAGLHIAALAVMLKVPVKKLEALEDNRFDLLPDAVFARALAASVCRTLKVDAAPILAMFPSTSKPNLMGHSAGINQQFQSPGGSRGPSMWAQLSRPAVLSVSALLLGALVLMFFPAIKAGIQVVKSAVVDSPLATLTGVGVLKPADKSVQFKSTSIVSEPAQVSSAGASTSSNGARSVPAENPEIGSLVTPNVSPAALPLPLDIKESVSGNTVAADIVVLTSQGDSWIEVTDAKGQTVLRRMLSSGQVVSATGPLPLKVVVGKANVTQVQIRGQAFDLNPVSKDNVARFEVK